MAKCYFYDIVEPDPTHLGVEKWIRIHQLMEKPNWFGRNGTRYGFVSTLVLRNILAGFFANEGKKRRVQYSDDKKPILNQDPIYSFELLFFAIFLDTSQLVLQHRNIYGYEDFGMGDMRENFLESLAILFRLANVGVTGSRVKIESAGEEYSQDEMYNFFIENQTLKIYIKELNIAKIPSEADKQYKLYNPKDDWHEITWGAVADTLRAGTREALLNAAEESSDAALNKAPLARAFAASGNIEEVVVISQHGNKIIRNRTKDEEISIPIDLEPENVPMLIEEIIRQVNTEKRIESWRERMTKRTKNNYSGTMFDNLQ